MENELTNKIVEMLAVGGGATTIAFLVFRFLGKSIVTNWFDLQKERYRQEGAEVLQRTKAEIDAHLSGTLKMQEWEYRTLPEIWELQVNALSRVLELTNPFFDDKDLDNMNHAELEEFFNTTRLAASQKEKIRNSKEKLRAYREELFLTGFREADNACTALGNILRRNRIFLPKEVMEPFAEIHDEIKNIIIDKDANIQISDSDQVFELWGKAKKLRGRADDLGSVLHERLCKYGTINPFISTDSKR